MNEIPVDTLQGVRASFRRATQENPRFFEEFYATLLSRNPRYVKMFGNVDMVHQYARLYAGIHKLFEYAENPRPETLHLVASIHDRNRVNVRPEHYLDWVDALLETLSRSDPVFGPELADRWVTVIMPGIEFMKSRY